MTNYTLIFQAILGLFAFLAVSWLFSEDRKNINYKAIGLGVIVQVTLAIIILKVDVVRTAFLWLSNGVMSLKDATQAGTSFVFGYLGGGDQPFALKEGASAFIFAFQPLPMLMVVSAISMLLFHWNILPVVVRGFSWALKKTMNIGGALGVCAAAKVFLGQTDAPLLVRPYLKSFSRSELFTVMTAGMATTSSSLMILYATILEKTIANPVAHILTASIISIPAAITISRLMIPHIGEDTSGHMVAPYKFTSSMEAVSQGTTSGLELFLNIIANLIVILALVALVNLMIGCLPHFDGAPLSLERMLGFVMAPIAWLMGMSWNEAVVAGGLLGKKAVLNEIVAFLGLAEIGKTALSPHSNLIMTYALCGFANLASIGIQIGSIGTMVPERRSEIIELGFRALIAGTIASCMSGTIVGLLYWWT